jgi:uncharacterized protein YbjT (DUF2867 family)
MVAAALVSSTTEHRRRETAMKIVVVGGTGFIGKKVVSILSERGHDVIAASPDTGVNTITREGLSAALAGAAAVLDVTNSPTFDEQGILDFFTTSTSNVTAAEKEAGVKHHVVLSIVGTEKLPENAYFRGKAAQEAVTRKSGVPFTIVHATQFMEYLGTIADLGTANGETRIPTANVQLVAADDLANELVEVVLSEPSNDIVQIAGPERARMSDAVAKYLSTVWDARQVTGDPSARYFGSLLESDTLVPVGTVRLGKMSFESWLEKRAPAK